MWRNGVVAIEEDFIVVVGEGLSTAGDGYGEGLSTVEDGDGEGPYTVEDGEGPYTVEDGEGPYTVEDGDREGLIIAHPDSCLATTKERRRTRAETPGGGGASDCHLRF
jgi:hypothetical protein